MDKPVHTEQVNGCTIKIFHDESPESPREWDNLGTMVCKHGRYKLGDTDKLDPDTKEEEIIGLPLYLFDHSGLSISTDCTMFSACDPDGWDWGRLGYIYVTKEKIRKEYRCKHITKKTLAKVLDVLRGEVKTYEQYLQGQVWGYVVEDAEGEQVDSCWGFFGDSDDEHMMNEARAAAKCHTDTLAKAESMEGAGV